MPFPIRLVPGFLLSLGVALLAYRRRSLSRSGVGGAVLTGTLTLGCGGWAWGLTLIAFFLSSSLLSHWRREHKAVLAGTFAKGERRDLGQALANGGLGTLLAVLSIIFPHPAWAAAFAGALAAATADTWATEVGVLSPAPPRLITTGEEVAVGTSGGITRWGTTTATGGGLFLGCCFYLFSLVEWRVVGSTACCPPTWTLLPLALVGGLSGSLVDSLLGATVQGIYRCTHCGRKTERRTHCGDPTMLVRGRPWLTNDGVNFLATLTGALVGGGWSLLLMGT